MQAIITEQAADGRTVASGTLAGGTHREEVPGLTGLRFIAAFSVLLGHSLSWFAAEHDTPWGVTYWLSQASGFGMTLFFVLSGFVIHYNYATLITRQRLRGVAAFLWARFARLYPLLLLMMIIYVLVSRRDFDFWSGHPERFNSVIRALPYFLLSLQSWFYVVIDGNPLISAIGGGSPITWSISTEWFFYWAYPCLAWLLLRSRTSQATVVAALLWCVLWIALAGGLYDRIPQFDAWAINHFGPIAGSQEHMQESFARWLLFFSPYLRIGEFILGALVAQLYVQLRERKVTVLENSVGTVVFCAAIASLVLITYLEYSPNVGMNIFRKLSMNFALAPSAATIIFCAARYRNAISQILNLRSVIMLGEASYSIYLVHDIVLISAIRLTGSAVHGAVYDAVKLVLLVALILLISLTLYSYYEAPARKWLRQRWGKRPSRAILAEAPQSSNL